MDKHFPTEFFISNRASLRELFTGTAPIVITANGLLQRNGDGTYPFQQDASFWYLTGINEADMILVMDKDTEYLIAPSISEYQNIFDGSQDTDELKKQSGVDLILDSKTGWKQLSTKLKKAKQVATLTASPSYNKTYGMYVNPARSVLIQRIKEINPNLQIHDLCRHMARLRSIKQPVELEAIQQAIDLTMAAIRTVKSKLAKFKYEFEVEAEITSSFLRHGAINAWKPIIASGVNACTLHSRDNLSELKPGNLIVIDVGAEYKHYCADITRTFSVTSLASRRSQAVHSAVLKAQDFALSLQKPGALIGDNEKKIETYIGECLRELGLVRTIDRESVRQYFPHATSHFLGLNPHDTGDYGQPLEPGMVLTVEPGIYIPKESLGVRIEDDIVITADGYRNLSSRLPRRL